MEGWSLRERVINMKFAIIDFETTGDSPSKDEIIQIGLVIINNMQIETVYSSFIRPSRSIPPFIQSLTGITDSMVAVAPELEEVVQQILPLLADCVLVGHNISFDLSFLQWALSQSGYYPFTGKILDTMDGLRLLYPTLGSYQLSFVASSFQIPHDRPHQADCDAQATAAIWLKCVEKLLSLPLLTLKRVLFCTL
jgi:ATP-dependent DNA helicase DinG